MNATSRDPGFVTGPVTLLLLFLIALVVIHGMEPPPAGVESAPPTDFSSARAMPDVGAIAQAPHPLASADNARVRGYIVGRLGQLGVDAQVQTVTAAQRADTGPDVWGVAHNIVAKIAGTGSTGAVVMVAHYDSVPSGPGAGDNAASVAAMLETIRALKAAAPLRNNLIFLFSDGEEVGLLGAKGFLENYADAASIKVVLNFDMRGDQGTSMLFETSARNAWLVDQFAAVAVNPVATSLSPTLYRMMPNDTDLSIFLDAGMPGMNFAATGGLTRYHTRLDDAPHLDPRTLQHQGVNALAMARRLGSIALDDPRVDEAVFFVAGATIIGYSTRLALPLAILIALLVAVAIAVGIRDRRFSVAGIAIGVALFGTAIAVAIVESRALWHLMAAIAGWRMLPVATTYGGFYYSMAVVALVFGSVWAIYAAMRRWVSVQNLAAGAILLWTVAMIASSAMLPGASYIFTWPLLFATLAFGRRSSVTNGHASVLPTIWALVGLVPATAMLAPLIVAIPDGTILFMTMSGLFTALLAGLFIPYCDLLTSGRRWIVPVAFGVLTAILIVRGARASNFDAEHPHPDSIFYLLDTDSATGSWVCVDTRPDVFTAQFFRHHVHSGWMARVVGLATDETPLDKIAALRNNGRTIEGDAPLINAPAPELKVIDDGTKAGVRTVRMHVASARNAPIVWMSVPMGVPVLGASIDGKSARVSGRASDGWTGQYWNAPAGGFELELQLASVGPFAVTVIDETPGLPVDYKIKPRPADTMPSPALLFDSTTLVRKTFLVGGETLTRR